MADLNVVLPKLQDVDAILRSGTNVESKIVDFWKDFRGKIQMYVDDLTNDDIDYVRIDGKKLQKDSAAALYKMEWWSSETESRLDALLKNIKAESDLANKLYSLFS